MSTRWLLVLLTGCQFIEEVRTDPETVSWGGTVQVDRSVTTGEVGELTAGAVSMLDPDGAPLLEAIQPFDDSPGYWRFDDAPVGAEVAIRLEADDIVPIVWRGTVPTGEALWFSGALYGREAAVYEAYFDALDGLNGIAAPTVGDPEVSVLWGEPLDPDAWAGVDITVTDGSGDEAALWRLAISDEGTISDAGDGAVDLFIAVNLAPGAVTLEAGGATTRWPAEGGDVLSAAFYELE